MAEEEKKSGFSAVLESILLETERKVNEFVEYSKMFEHIEHVSLRNFMEYQDQVVEMESYIISQAAYFVKRGSEDIMKFQGFVFRFYLHAARASLQIIMAFTEEEILPLGIALHFQQEEVFLMKLMKYVETAGPDNVSAVQAGKFAKKALRALTNMETGIYELPKF